MAALPITDYTSRDYASLVESLLDVAALKLPEWTDRSENDLGRVLIELFAYVGDTLLYYQDRIANEAFLATAVERRSVIDLLELIGYLLATAAPAAVALEVTPQDPAAPIRIDVGARFATEATEDQPAVEFAFLPESGVAIDQMPVVRADGTVEPILLTALHATPVEAPLGTSNGLDNQAFPLPQPGVLLAPDPAVPDGFELEIEVGGGWERWERRVTLLNSLPSDPHFVVRVDENDEGTVYLGDGTYGRVPPAGAPVRAGFRVGGGAGGNVGPMTVNVVASGVSARATVTNPAPASGGADRESEDHARLHAPGVFRSQHRAVTAEDFTVLTAAYPGVARAQAVSAGWNYVDVLVIAEGGLGLTDALRANLVRYLDARRMVTTIVSVRNPVFVSIDANITVGVEPTFYADDVASRARGAVAAVFEVENLEFGRSFALSKLFEAVEAVPGVDFVEVSGFSGRRSEPPDELVDPAAAAAGRVPLRPREFPRRGTVAVNATGGL